MKRDELPAKTKKLLIVGNSEIAVMAYEYFTWDSEFEVVGFSIGEEFIEEGELCGLEVLPLEGIEQRFWPDKVEAFVAIGDSKLNRVRREHFDLMKAKGYRLASFVSSRAAVWHNVKVGENCFIFEDNVLQPFTEVGDNSILWSGNHIGHRTVIEEDVFIASHVVISGYCRIGRSSFLGVNVAVANGVKIGADNFVGMGANITKDTQPNMMWKAQSAEARSTGPLEFFRIR